MKFTELEISGAWLIEPEPQIDERGVFRRHFCAEEFSSRGIVPAVAQGNISENPKKHTLRGFHFQVPPFEEAKTLSCVSGAIYDVVVDLRAASPSFMKWVSIEISASDRRSLHVPTGCANAWLTTEPNTMIHYYMSHPYNPAAGRGFRYNDPAFGFLWPAAPAVISKKDLNYQDFSPDMLT
jgi:dTDP-4-dehydrorhamnose 3,5-epimerase